MYVYGVRAFWAIGPGNRIGVTFEYNLLDLATRSPWSPAEAIRLHRFLADKLEHFQVCPSTFLLDPFLGGWSGSRAFATQKHKLSYQFLGWKTLTFEPIVEREEFWLSDPAKTKTKKTLKNPAQSRRNCPKACCVFTGRSFGHTQENVQGQLTTLLRRGRDLRVKPRRPGRLGRKNGPICDVNPAGNKALLPSRGLWFPSYGVINPLFILIVCVWQGTSGGFVWTPMTEAFLLICTFLSAYGWVVQIGFLSLEPLWSWLVRGNSSHRSKTW